MARLDGSAEEDPQSCIELTPDEYEWLQQQLQGVADLHIADEYEDEWIDPTEGLLTEVLAACEDGSTRALEELEELLPKLKCTEFGIDAAGPDGDSPLHIACLYGNKQCAELLLEHGSDPCFVNPEDSTTALHDAAAGGYLDLVQLLLEKAGIGLLTKVDSDGDTPLHNAARGGHCQVVQLLLANGANPAARNQAGNTPAQEADDEDTIAALKEAMQRQAAAAGAGVGAETTGGGAGEGVDP
jgi:ankyrin repeat protein